MKFGDSTGIKDSAGVELKCGDLVLWNSGFAPYGGVYKAVFKFKRVQFFQRGNEMRFVLEGNPGEAIHNLWSDGDLKRMESLPSGTKMDDEVDENGDKLPASDFDLEMQKRRQTSRF